jgi:hypothetical protein
MAYKISAPQNIGNYQTTGLVGQRTLITLDSLETITTAGYINIADYLQPGDLVIASYTAAQIVGLFYASITSDVITLVPVASGVQLIGGATIGHLVKFASTSGNISDTGLEISDPTQTYVSSSFSPTVVGAFAQFADTKGTLIGSPGSILSGITSPWTGEGTSNSYEIDTMTNECVGSCVILSSTTPVSIVSAVPGTNALLVNFSANPGANTIVSYIYTTVSFPL